MRSTDTRFSPAARDRHSKILAFPSGGPCAMTQRILLLVLSLISAVAAAGRVRADDGSLAVQIVDALNKAYGEHPGFRANHAKGIVAEGSFEPAREAAKISRSPLFAGGKLPITVRFSDASGIPTVPGRTVSKGSF